MAKLKTKSRPSRWRSECINASNRADELLAALQNLLDIQSEYQDWLDNLPENLQSSTTAEKLQAVTDLDIYGAVSSIEEIQSLITEADDLELPRGFGND